MISLSLANWLPTCLVKAFSAGHLTCKQRTQNTAMPLCGCLCTVGKSLQIQVWYLWIDISTISHHNKWAQRCKELATRTPQNPLCTNTVCKCTPLLTNHHSVAAVDFHKYIGSCIHCGSTERTDSHTPRWKRWPLNKEGIFFWGGGGFISVIKLDKSTDGLVCILPHQSRHCEQTPILHCPLFSSWTASAQDIPRSGV